MRNASFTAMSFYGWQNYIRFFRIKHSIPILVRIQAITTRKHADCDTENDGCNGNIELMTIHFLSFLKKHHALLTIETRETMTCDSHNRKIFLKTSA